MEYVLFESGLTTHTRREVTREEALNYTKSRVNAIISKLDIEITYLSFNIFWCDKNKWWDVTVTADLTESEYAYIMLNK